MGKMIHFNGKDYSENDLKQMSVEDLLSLRNLIASNLGVAAVKSFKDHDTAITQTWKALSKYEDTVSEETAQADQAEEKPKKAKKAPKEKKERGLAKSSMPQVVKRPTRKMFSTIKKTGEHDGSQGRAHRWPNYKDGMTIVDIMEGEGTEPWDVYNWQGQGIMEVIEPTDDEYTARRAAWYQKHGLEDPDVKKAREKVEKEKRKAEKEAAKAESKADA